MQPDSTFYKYLIPLLLVAVLIAGCGTEEPPMAGTDETADQQEQTAAPAEPTEADSPPEGDLGEVAVGSKDFTEEFIIAEMYALLLEEAGFEVERKFNLGGTPIAHQAILDGDINLYPEYTSTGLLTVLGLEPMKDAEAIVDKVRAEYEDQFDLTWLEPAPFNNTQALATTQEIADEHDLETFSDLASKAPELRLGGPAEFAEREDGIPGLQAEYGGFEFQDFVQLGTGNIRYDALQAGQVDVVVAFGTDGRIAGDDLVVLRDDKGLYPVYQVAPVVRLDTLEDQPEIPDTLNPLAELLTDETMSNLNYQVDVAGEEYQDVALQFLLDEGLVTR